MRIGMVFLLLAGTMNFLQSIYIQLGWPSIYETDPDWARAAFHMAYAAVDVGLAVLFLLLDNERNKS